MRTHTRTRVHTRSQADVTTHPPRATATSAGTVGVRRQQGCGLAQHTGVLRATTVAVAERSLRGTRHPGHPTLPETRAAPWDSWECWPRICPLQAGPSQSPTSDHRRCPLRWRWRPLGRGDGDIPGELPRRFPHAVPECDRVLRLPTQLPLPRGHGGSARQDPSLPDPISHASQMRGCPSGRSATLREGRPLLPDGNVAALSLVRGQGPEGIGSPPCVLPERSGRPCVLGHCTGCRPRSISAPGACGCHTGTAEPGVRTRRPRAASSADGFSRQGIGSASKHILSKLYQRKDFPCH